MARHPTPTAVLEARGSRWAKGREGEPRPDVGAPAAPPWLDREAKAEWRRVVGLMLRVRTVTEMDRPVLAAYCASWSEWVRLSKQVLTEAASVTGSHGGLVRNPAFAARDAAEDRMMRAALQLGMGPVARTRVRSADGAGEDRGKARFFGGAAG